MGYDIVAVSPHEIPSERQTYFPEGGQSSLAVTRLGMQHDYETPFVKFLLGTLKHVYCDSSHPPRWTLVLCMFIHNFYNLLTFADYKGAVPSRSFAVIAV